ncbi:MAG: tetratricopeptide repeat protein [Pseudomonadota bacterium]
MIFTIGFFLMLSTADVRAGGMSMVIYQRLQAVEELIRQEQYQTAEARLDELLADMPARSEDRAYIYYTAGMLHLQQSDFQKADPLLTAAYNVGGFPDKTGLYILQTLAGLSMQAKEYATAARYYRQYIDLAPEPDPNAWLGLGTAGYYLNDHPLAIRTLTHAVRLFPENEMIHFMLFSSYYETGQLEQASAVMEKLVRRWPEKPNYWRQLCSIYLERRQQWKALEIMEPAYVKGILSSEQDILQFVHTLYEERLPYKAAGVLQLAMDRNMVAKSCMNYEWLSTLYQEAKERTEAIRALQSAAVLSKDGRNDLCIAQLYYDMESEYHNVIKHAKLACEKGIPQAGDAEMLIAIAYHELDQYEDARKYFMQASRYAETREPATQWLHFLESIP